MRVDDHRIVLLQNKVLCVLDTFFKDILYSLHTQFHIMYIFPYAMHCMARNKFVFEIIVHLILRVPPSSVLCRTSRVSMLVHGIVEHCSEKLPH